MELEKEYNLYLEKKADLLKEHKNKFLVIKDDEIYDSFASYEDALIYGLKKIGNVPFLIQQVMEEEPIHFFTHDVGFQCHA